MVALGIKSLILPLHVAVASVTTAARHPLIRGSAATTEPQVFLRNGTITGFHLSSYKQDAFLGIPFAQPPIGPLRFSLPQPVMNAWNSTIRAQSYPYKCAGYGTEQIGDFEVSEDCLYLNVVKPSGYGERRLPVAVWIHGGGELTSFSIKTCVS